MRVLLVNRYITKTSAAAKRTLSNYARNLSAILQSLQNQLKICKDLVGESQAKIHLVYMYYQFFGYFITFIRLLLVEYFIIFYSIIVWAPECSCFCCWVTSKSIISIEILSTITNSKSFLYLTNMEL